MRWNVVKRPALRRALDEDKPLDALIEQVARTKASIRAKVEYPFRVLKRQFEYAKVRYRGLKKNRAQIVTLFALSNLWMARYKLAACMGQVRRQGAQCPSKPSNDPRAAPAGYDQLPKRGLLPCAHRYATARTDR
jgi:IS5 family transposase